MRTEATSSEDDATRISFPSPPSSKTPSARFWRSVASFDESSATTVPLEDADWIRRSAAAEALRYVRRADRSAAVAALVKSLADPDGFVARQAVTSLAALDDVSAAPPLADALAEFRRRGDEESARETIVALRKLTGRKVDGDDPARWAEQAALAKRAASDR